MGRRCWRISRAIINTSGLMKAANDYNLSECCEFKTHLHEHAYRNGCCSGDQRAYVIYNRLGLYVLCLASLEKMMMMIIISFKQQSFHHMALK